MNWALLIGALTLVPQPTTMSIGLRDHSVVEGVPVLVGKLPRPALEVLGVVVGRESLNTARARLGPTPLRDAGEPHDALAICYAVPSADATVFLEAGELEQGITADHPVDSFALMKGITPGCARLPAKRVSTRGGLRLGLTAKQVENHLGRPSTRSEGLMLYLFRSAGTIGVAEVHLYRGVVQHLVVGEWQQE